MQKTPTPGPWIPWTPSFPSHRLGPAHRQAPPDPADRGAVAGLSAQTRCAGAARGQKTPHLSAHSGSHVDHRGADLGNPSPHAGERHRGRVRGGADYFETAAEATEEDGLSPVCLTLCAHCGSVAAGSDSELFLCKKVQEGGADFRISCHTFRHSFAVHLLLHGRPLKVVSQLLGHRSVDSTEIYTNVLTVDAAHFLDGVDFH